MAFLTFDSDGHGIGSLDAILLDTDTIHDILIYNHTQSTVRFFATVNSSEAVINALPDIPGRDFRGHFQRHFTIAGEPAVELVIPANTASILQVTTPGIATIFDVITRDNPSPTYRRYGTRTTHGSSATEGQRLWFEIVNRS